MRKFLGVNMVSPEFISKIEYNCYKKESLFNQNKVKYAIRSVFAGAFLTLTTAAGAIALPQIFLVVLLLTVGNFYSPSFLLGV